MKKILYAAAALLAVVACNKNEMNETPCAKEGTFNISLSIAPSTADTKALFDGDSHMAFEKGDALYAALAKPEAPNVLSEVATREGAAASTTRASFVIADAAAGQPVFNGNFWSIVEEQYAEEFNLYTVFPSYAFSNGDTADDWRVTIPKEQTASQTSWDKKANAMMGLPVKLVPADASYDEKYGEYSFAGALSVEFAHLFGFGKFTLAGVPAEYQELNVNSVVIEAVGENKNLAGSYTVDISKKVSEIEPEAGYSTSSSITVTPAEAVAVKDLVVWFEANTGVFDVKVTVATDRADLIFERSGLKINRGEIAAPTIHFKASDTAASHDVVLVDGETWAQASLGYSDCLSSSRKVVEWGPSGKKMKFSVAYPGQTNSNYPTYFSADNGYVQGLAYNTFTAGKVLLYSRAAFHGVYGVKINLGIYNANSSCDANIGFANGADTTWVKTVKVVTGEKQTANGEYYYIDDIDAAEGDFILLVNNLSDPGIRPTVGGIVLNPAPELVPEFTKIKLEKTAATGTFACPLYMSKETPAVETDAAWLAASWADGVITYSATENTDVKRTAKITVKAAGTECVIDVTQKSANAVEYKLNITPAVINPYLTAAHEANPTATTAAVNGIDVVATATDGSGKTITVTFDAANATIDPISEESYKLKSTLKTRNSIGYIGKVVVNANKKVTTGNYDMNCQMSKDGSKYDKITAIVTEGTSPSIVSTITNDDEDYTWLTIDCTNWSTVTFNDIEVTFVSE